MNRKKILQLPEAVKVNGYTFRRSNSTIFFLESLPSDAVCVLFANFSYTMNCQTDPRAMLEYFVHEICHSKHSKTGIFELLSMLKTFASEYRIWTTKWQTSVICSKESYKQTGL